MSFRRWVHFYQARFFVLLKQDARAINAYQLALEADKDFGLAASCLGHLYASQGQTQLAERYFLGALRIAPDDAVTHFNLGFIYETQKKYEEAVTAFQTAVRLKPKIDRAWYGLGLAYTAQGRLEAAAEAFENAATLQPMNPHAWYNLGMTYYTLRNQDKVSEIIGHLNRFDPKMTKKLIQDTGGNQSQ
jgi:tetratricopeptide (TPR) repeat protein